MRTTILTRDEMWPHLKWNCKLDTSDWHPGLWEASILVKAHGRIKDRIQTEVFPENRVDVLRVLKLNNITRR